MTRNTKKLLIIIGSVAAIFIAAFFFANHFVEKKVSQRLGDLPDHIKINYEELDIHLLGSRLDLKAPKVKVFSKITADRLNLEMSMDNLAIDGLSYWDYLFNDAVTIENIVFDNFKTSYRHNPEVKQKDYKTEVSKNLGKTYHVNIISLRNGSFEMIGDGADSLQLKVLNMSLDLKEVSLNNQTKEGKVPFKLKDFDLKVDSLFYAMNDFENLEVGSIDASMGQTRASQLRLKTKYSRATMDEMIETERDHFNLEVKSIQVSDQDFGYINDSTPYFKTGSIKIQQPEFAIYRNKLIADDQTIKALYSEQLRDLNLQLTIPSVEIEKGAIEYAEKTTEGNPAGTINFTNLNATIENLSNTYPKGELTQIEVQSTFMNETSIDVQWNFDVNNTADYFTFQGNVGSMPVESLNSFIKPNEGVKLKGELLKTYFTIQGNREQSDIDFKIDYDDFEVVILKDDGTEESGFLSAVANIFVKKSSQNEDADFRKSSKSTIQRDKTKSVFNYVWISIAAGLKGAMM